MLSPKEVQDLANLARLKLNEAEVASLQKDISSILEYVGQVSAIEQGDTLLNNSKESPLQRNVMREDTPREALHPLGGKEKSVRAAFPTREGDYNVVRKIIQKDE